MAKTAKKAAKKVVAKKPAAGGEATVAKKAVKPAEEGGGKAGEEARRGCIRTRQAAFYPLRINDFRANLYRWPDAVAVQVSVLLFPCEPARGPAQAAGLPGQEPLRTRFRRCAMARPTMCSRRRSSSTWRSRSASSTASRPSRSTGYANGCSGSGTSCRCRSSGSGRGQGFPPVRRRSAHHV